MQSDRTIEQRLEDVKNMTVEKQLKYANDERIRLAMELVKMEGELIAARKEIESLKKEILLTAKPSP